MNIHQIIRQRRIEKGLTQEQVAGLLGVSAPAVNKWERAVSYPDITQLPALARLLDTDLNTLLCFQEEPSETEIWAFLRQLSSDADTHGGKYAFRRAMEKVREFPNCDTLLLNTALTLEGIFRMLAVPPPVQDWEREVEQLYQRAAQSGQERVSSQARSMLICKLIERREFSRAQELLDTLPSGTLVEKQQLQANWYVAQEQWEEAARLTEQRLLSALGGVQSALFTLGDLAIKEERLEDARYIAAVLEQLVHSFDLWEYGAYAARIELAVKCRDAGECLEVLRKLLPAITEPWNPGDSPLYAHLTGKGNGGNLGERLLTQILRELEDPGHKEYDFLRGEPEFEELLCRMKQGGKMDADIETGK